MFRHFLDAGVDPFEVRRRVGKVTVEDLTVLDLTDVHVCARLGVTNDDLLEDDYRHTQAVAHAAANAGFEGILAPSAALHGQVTLVVFAAGMSHLAASPSRVRQPPPRLVNLIRAIRPHPQVPETVRTFLGATAQAGAEAIRRRRRRSNP